MLGQVFLRGWVVALLCLSSFGFPSQATAVQMPDPDLLMSETGLMLLEIDDVPGTMVKAKKFFDGVYKEHREQGVLGPLQTPMTQYIFQQAKGDQPTHWLIKAVDSIATEGTELEKVWRPIAEKLAKDPTQVTPEEEDEVIAAFARLFKGKMFIGEEDHKPYRTTIFGFEYDPQVFDWMKELRLVAERQRKRFGDEDQSTSIAGIEVIHLPNEGWFVFSVNNVIYGVSARHVDIVAAYVGRAIHISGSEKPTWSPLRSGRWYQRTVACGENLKKPIRDVRLFLDWKGFVSRVSEESISKRRYTQSVIDRKFLNSFEAYSVYGCSFDISPERIVFELATPLLVPHDLRVQQIQNEYSQFSVPRQFEVPSGTQRALWVLPRPAQQVSGVWKSFPLRSSVFSTYLLSMSSEKGNWKSEPDLISVVENCYARKGLDEPIGHFVFRIPHEDKCFYLPGIALPLTKIGSSEAVLAAINREVIDNHLSAEVLSRPLPEGLGIHEKGGLSCDRLPKHRILDDSEELIMPSAAESDGPYRLLATHSIGSCRILYVGAKEIDFAIVENGTCCLVLPCFSEFALARLINSVTASNGHLIPKTLHDEVQGQDKVVQVMYQNRFDYRSIFLDEILPHVANGMEDGLIAENYQIEESSTLEILSRIFVDVVGVEADRLEQVQMSISRKEDPVDIFRCLLFREQNMVQLGSMTLRDY